MNILSSKLYQEEVEMIANNNIEWSRLENKTILITGATGLIGSLIVDVLMHKNINNALNCKIIAIGRNSDRARIRFSKYYSHRLFLFFEHNILNPLPELGKCDFIIHGASNTHPMAYSMDPVGTITSNVVGMYNLLTYSAQNKTERILLLSSVEIYGENRGDTEYFDENYCGYLNPNTLRAGYPESKRTAETLCQAFLKQYSTDFVTIRLPRTYGPTMLMDDSKALSQFLRNALHNENIVLKSSGTQLYSYAYVADVINGILIVLLRGETGNAYNLADSKSNVTLKELAEKLADIAEVKVIFEIPSEAERVGYSTATKALMDSSKIREIGWVANYNLDDGLRKTIDIMDDISF